MKGISSFAATFLALGLATIITGCGGNSPTIFPSNISVTVGGGLPSVMATGTAVFTAVVTGDSAGKGVTWSVSCSAAPCGSIATGPPNGMAGNYNGTYTAPPTPPTSDLIVTVKAVSVADSSKFGTATITVSAITITFNIGGNGITASTATTATVQVGTGNFVVMNVILNNDPANAGVTFAISPASQTANLSGQSPFSVQYNAPTTPPASDLTVTITATSVTDSTKKVTLTITVPSVTVSITPATATVEATGTVPIVAAVGNDPSGKGVAWSISCSLQSCGSVAPSPTPSGTPTTYTAPPTPPSSDLMVTLTAQSVADPAAQNSMIVTVKAILVTVTAPNGTVQFGQTVGNIVATVQFDPANKGVTWAIQPCGAADCGSISLNATLSGQAITYTAPANPPANNLPVQIVATSDSDPNQTGSVQITVLAIGVVVSPGSAIIPTAATAALNATPFTVTVSNDSSNQGATWALTQNGTACSPACGTITPTSTGACSPACAPTTYAAPSSVPADAQVTLTARSVEDTTKFNSVTITLTAGTVKLIPANLAFGRLKISNSHPTKTLTETLTNTGGSALNITGQAVMSGPYTINPCKGSITTSVASGASCGISVTFAPLTTGTFNTNLTITDNDTTSPQQVPITGSACTRCRGGADIREAVARNLAPMAPAPTGPYTVGTRTVDLIDPTRSEPFAANGSKRELLVRFWYPAASTHGCRPAPYTSSGVWNYMAHLERVSPPQVRTNSCQDAMVTSEKHPVVVFTHGFTGIFTDYTFLFEDLASRGYVVVSVNHTFEATAVEFPDGRLIKSIFGSHLGETIQLDTKTASFAVAVRLGDLKFVLDELQKMNTSQAGLFAGKLDLSRVAVAGHSLGGLTALLGIEMEPRFRVALDLDGVTPGPLFGTTKKPVFMLFAGRNPWDQDTCHVWGKLTGPRLGVSFKGSEHLTPSDAVWLASGAVQTGTMGMEKTVEAIRSYISAFLDSSLNGNPVDKLLQGASADYPDVEVTTQAQSPCTTRSVQK